MAWNAIDLRIAFINNLSIWCLNVSVNKGIGVHISYTHSRNRRHRLNQPMFNGKAANRAQHIAAVWRRIHPPFIDDDLNKQIIDIRFVA